MALTLGLGVFRSSDNGMNWTPVNNGLTVTGIKALAVNTTCQFAATDVGVFRSTDLGDNWTAANNGLTATDVTGLAVSGETLFATTFACDSGPCTSQVFRSIDNGANWTALDVGGASAVYVMGASATSVFLLAADGHAYRSADNGASWTTAEAVPLPGTVLWSGTTLFLGMTVIGMYRSTDDGAHWAPFNDGFPPGLFDVRAMAVSGTNLFAATWQAGASSGMGWERVQFWRRSL
jgi:hypothetical protein